jgi:dynein heavy chain, axonemal
VYDVKSCSLLIFGGWSNRWLGDLVKLNVSPIIGPPYACIGIEPDGGPVFGESELIVKGLRFKEGKIQVKFGTNEKNEVVVDAEFVSTDMVKVRTPNYEQFGAMAVDVKVSINGEGWTVNKIRFSYFANTAARNCIPYGPGLLEKGIAGVEVPFLIQAKDTANEKRHTGGDRFQVRVVSVDGKVEGSARVTDLHNGLYQALYSAPLPGKYSVSITHSDLGSGEPVPVRGSPFLVECQDPWTRHRLMGNTPSKRKGAVLQAVSSSLVLYGGDKSGLSVCNTEGADWKWSNPTAEGDVPLDRTLHACTVNASDEMVVFGGQNLNDGSDLAGVHFLSRNGDGWVWHPALKDKPYARWALA